MASPFWSPSRKSVARIIYVGRNRIGNWVACEERGVFGGLFVTRAQALKYALFENGGDSDSIIEVTREIELYIGTDQ
ncbi:hypothetical protein [Bradyrhizobium elkanii]|uniref:RNase H type-1 domain-containing protein n=2 Tax=Bradyrhizobium elkanii TaxID=29448 RepID=A0ABV4EV58_BRAEL|nr:hypothetical protein [Bradyrhizobium elkanii]MCP1755693.1 hypothetical protein [Bradyrhizobium elkanii]MCP1981209.1 hypothetical protein [Bradyrhizobium elkanii]MCS3689431.1 hypothetical protein [Bradyrhizobium elkanii]MCS3884012.1 hypothetical protein [Bradyrhizobium elkanii]MCS4216959.1 hypothetical protein [Bradyrhizobium elkanii]